MELWTYQFNRGDTIEYYGEAITLVEYKGYDASLDSEMWTAQNEWGEVDIYTFATSDPHLVLEVSE